MNIEQRADKRESEKETTTQQPIINLLSERRSGLVVDPFNAIYSQALVYHVLLLHLLLKDETIKMGVK